MISTLGYMARYTKVRERSVTYNPSALFLSVLIDSVLSLATDFGFEENFNNCLKVEEKKNKQNRIVAQREPPPPPVPPLPPRKGTYTPSTNHTAGLTTKERPPSALNATPVRNEWVLLVLNAETGTCSVLLNTVLLFRGRFQSVDRSISWSDSPSNYTMRQAMMSSHSGSREGLLKYRLSKKEKEYVDIKNFRWVSHAWKRNVSDFVLVPLIPSVWVIHCILQVLHRHLECERSVPGQQSWALAMQWSRPSWCLRTGVSDRTRAPRSIIMNMKHY